MFVFVLSLYCVLYVGSTLIQALLPLGVTQLYLQMRLKNAKNAKKNVRKQGRDGRDTRIQLPYIYCIKYLYESIDTN